MTIFFSQDYLFLSITTNDPLMFQKEKKKEKEKGN